jgi:hypothetical protein
VVIVMSRRELQCDARRFLTINKRITGGELDNNGWCEIDEI